MRISPDAAIRMAIWPLCWINRPPIAEPPRRVYGAQEVSVRLRGEEFGGQNRITFLSCINNGSINYLRHSICAPKTCQRGGCVTVSDAV